MDSAPVSHPPSPRPEPAPDADCTVIVRPSAALPPGTRLGEYELTEVVGQGGFGIVYLAWDHFLACRFAIKEYMPAAIAQRGVDALVTIRTAGDRDVFELGLRSFVNEAQMLAGFDHPALVKVYRFWQANGTAYMLMPYYEGPTLKDILEGGTHAIDQAWLSALLRPLCDALDLLHDAHCFHRDIAPDNIKLRSDTGLPVLLDFGAARRVIGDVKRELTAIYKPAYAPVEQREDSPMAQGPWTDLYALAAVLYRAITGTLPPSPVARLAQECYVPLARQAAGRFDAGFLAAIDHALQVRPQDRTPSISVFRAELGLDAPLPESRGPSGGEAASRAVVEPVRTAPLAAIALACVTLAVGAASWWWSRPAEPLSAPPSIVAARTDAGVAVASAPVVAPPAPPPQPGASAASTGPRSTLLEPIPAFDRLVARQTPGFAVTASARKPLLRVDRDALALSVASARDGHVVVLLRDADGSLAMLFPNAAAPRLTVRHDRPLELPRLMARKPAGRQALLVIVSSRPVPVGAGSAVDEVLAQWGGGDYGAVRLDVDIVQ